MAQLTCSICGLEAEDDDLVCRGCSGNLSRPVAARHPLPGAGAPGAAGEGGPAEEDQEDQEEGPLVCPHCGAPVPVPTNQVCVACQRLLGEARPTRTAPAEARPTRTAPAEARLSRTAAVDARATRRDRPTTVLRIRFGAVERTVVPGGTLLLGRAPAAGATRGLLARHDNVSRRHATVGLEPDGTAWVRDEHSTNGTFVNGSPVGAGVRTPLRDGDVLRLAADCTLVIALDGPDEG
ncbi:FHA domain-containing protein [Streptomyces sp. PanSC19]|uniref:FHA domain-containing protein n=1 Tax=Streptomyces sp. PanSC19 TaxID=1520455 RepID=UPI000FBB1EBC|nr:FHA domain-containing protein [Streptomyces sp. PanSC19]ROQ34863.1 FHA domain-containing protein [Streptomyces sp. PanSC19]